LETEAIELVFGGSERLIARGVKITNKRTGASTTVYATKEVVLAADAVNTPKLLQLSGVDPKSLTIDPTFNASAWEQYRANKTGPLTQARGNSLAFIPFPEVNPQGYRSLARQVRHQKNYEYMPSTYKNSAKLLKGVMAQRMLLANLFSPGLRDLSRVEKL
jgi:hypothetical protein